MNYPELKLFINGEWVSHTTSGTFEVVNPADGSVLGTAPIAGPAELELAERAAAQAFPVWARMVPLDRFKVITKATSLMRARVNEIARILTLEQGKPLAEAQREVLLSADIIDFLAEEAKRLPLRNVPPRVANIIAQTVQRVPVGPVAAFTPWNFPCNLPARKLGGALAAGCSVVIKPAEETPATCLEIARAFADAGLPAGVLNVVFGDPAQISEALISSRAIAKVSFTGSTRVGRLLGALSGQHLKRYTAELGGHAPVVVCADADPVTTAKLSVTAKYRGAGQVCASPIRFMVHRSIYAQFRETFVTSTLALKVGNGLDDGVNVGPLIAERRLSEMQSLVDDAVGQGAKLLCGGHRLDRPGFFYAPTVLEDVPRTCRVQQEEPFGPIALLEPFDDLEVALERANSLPYGLAAYVFTRDLATAHRFGQSLEAGMVGINHFGVSQPETPFGGMKDSGMGSESGLEGLLAYTDVKLVSVAT
ncbi:aldehyde dehydrogenase [Burkholderiaceae bacterium 26]|nr:aldehyde dehydrogenase [Burkholderiaceae bacterium 26]